MMHHRLAAILADHRCTFGGQCVVHWKYDQQENQKQYPRDITIYLYNNNTNICNTRTHRTKLAACLNKYNQIQNNKMVKTNTNHDSYMTETKTEILTVTSIYTNLVILTAIFLNKHGSLGPGPFSLHSMDHWLCLTHKSPKTWDYS